MKRNILTIKTRVISALLLGACLTFTLPAAATFASTGEDEVMTIQIQSISPEDEAIMNKQIEIDQYLFKQHIKDIEEKGFKVIYTGVSEGKVEIGITPFSEKNANYLYELFGNDMVKVIETEAVELKEDAYTSMPESTMVITAAPDSTTLNSDVKATDAVTTTAVDSAVTTTSEEIYTTTAVQEKSAKSSSVPTTALYGGATILALSGAFLIVNKRKAVK